MSLCEAPNSSEKVGRVHRWRMTCVGIVILGTEGSWSVLWVPFISFELNQQNKRRKWMFLQATDKLKLDFVFFMRHFYVDTVLVVQLGLGTKKITGYGSRFSFK